MVTHDSPADKLADKRIPLDFTANVIPKFGIGFYFQSVKKAMKLD